MATQTDLVAFEQSDADGLLAMLGGAGGQSISRSRVPQMSSMLGQVKTGGLAAGSEGSVWLMNPTATGWTVSANSCPAWTIGTTIAADSTVLLIAVNGRWLALKVC
jgi:hypothetical protein